jgi:surface protein
MFNGATAFNGNIGSWNLARVTTMQPSDTPGWSRNTHDRRQQPRCRMLDFPADGNRPKKRIRSTVE